MNGVLFGLLGIFSLLGILFLIGYLGEVYLPSRRLKQMKEDKS